MSALEDLFDNFHCTICCKQYTQISIPLVICTNHHLVCSLCYKGIARQHCCPFCKQFLIREISYKKQLFNIKKAAIMYKEMEQEMNQVRRIAEKQRIAKKQKNLDYLRSIVPEQYKVLDYAFQKYDFKNSCLGNKSISPSPQLVRQKLRKLNDQFMKMKDDDIILIPFLRQCQKLIEQACNQQVSYNEKQSKHEQKPRRYWEKPYDTDRLSVTSNQWKQIENKGRERLKYQRTASRVDEIACYALSSLNGKVKIYINLY